MKRNPIFLYNLFPLLYGEIKNWYKPVETAKNMGFNTVFLNPVFQSGRSGSLYSIKDYFKIDKRFSNERTDKKNWGNLKKFIKFVHKNNMKIVVDIVLNHTAVDSPLIKRHREWFVFKKGKIQRPGAFDLGRWIEWRDLAQVDNKNSKDKKNLYNYWWKVLEYYFDLGFDGFRADAAYQVPVKLWSLMIEKSKKKKSDVIFLGETLGCNIDDTVKIAKCGFDYTFNSIKYWNYRDNWVLEQLYKQLMLLKDVFTIGFPESHDTQRLFSEAGGDMNKVKARILLVSFWSSGIMITSGLEYCYKKKLSVVNTNISYIEDTGRDITEYIRNVINLKKKYRILREDSYIEKIEPKNSGDVLVLLKISKNRKERCLFICNRNFSDYERVYFKDIFDVFKIKGSCCDISLKYTMDSVPKEFEYYLRPGQVKILFSSDDFIGNVKHKPHSLQARTV